MSGGTNEVVKLWWSRLDAIAAALRLATPDAHSRAARFVHSADRKRSLIGSVLLKSLAADTLGCDVTSVGLARECRRCGMVSSEPNGHGRPIVINNELCLSLSHSDDLVCAAASWAPIGVDIERVRPLAAPEIDMFLGPDEPAPEAGGAEAIALWTRKESFLKATGEGLAASPSQVRVGDSQVRVGDSAPARPAFRPADLTCVEVHGHVWDLEVPPGYRGAVTVLSHCSSTFELPRFEVTRDALVAVDRA
ncbi:4'-phosphopantetheinyl transferase family protein [Brevibacterium casei]|uniref:4'-phosphopantetheinyl transferase family protein n=1 Tax=Brevibacterium casei TaxID=33889 RepID=UPI0035CD17C2